MLPPGVTIGQYLRFATASMLSMLAGSQFVHAYYKPLSDIDKYVEKELQSLPEETRRKLEPIIHQNS